LLKHEKYLNFNKNLLEDERFIAGEKIMTMFEISKKAEFFVENIKIKFESYFD
jgi:hypothetical protein